MAHEDMLERRMRCDEQILVTLEAHTAQLRSARIDALAALSSAQASLATIDDELSQSEQRVESVKNFLQASRSSLWRRQVDALPVELLREVFLIIATEPNELCPPDQIPEYDTARSLQPFALAAVCRRWRALALATPVLWHYIAIPPPGEQSERFSFFYPSWVQTLLRRSKGSYIDILLLWKDDSTCLEEDTYASKILAMLCRHTSRWRRFEFYPPEKFINLDSCAMFRHPMPLLEQFCVVSGDSASFIEWTSPFPRFLPITPKLKSFKCENNNIIITVLSTSLQNLIYIDICVGCACAHVWGLLSSTPALQTLSLQFWDDYTPDDIEEVPTTPVLLRSLSELILGDMDSSGMLSNRTKVLSLPALTHLQVYADLEVLEPFLLAHGSSVQYLHVWNMEITLDDLPGIRALSNVSEVHFTETTLHDDLLQAIAVADDILPKVTGIHLKSVAFEPSDGDGLVHIVRLRNLPQNSGSASTVRPNILSCVTIEDCPSIEQWLVAEIRYLLGEAIRESDDESTVEDDGSGSSEAQFTDGESTGEEGSGDTESDDESWIDSSDDSSSQENESE